MIGDNVPATDAYPALCRFDTVFLIDDSPSMRIGKRWEYTADTVAAIAPMCTKRDPDGIDIYFLNNLCKNNGVKTGNEVMWIFSRVFPEKGGKACLAPSPFVVGSVGLPARSSRKTHPSHPPQKGLEVTLSYIAYMYHGPRPENLA
jgi:hypothetical protein